MRGTKFFVYDNGIAIWLPSGLKYEAEHPHDIDSDEIQEVERLTDTFYICREWDTAVFAFYKVGTNWIPYAVEDTWEDVQTPMFTVIDTDYGKEIKSDDGTIYDLWYTSDEDNVPEKFGLATLPGGEKVAQFGRTLLVQHGTSVYVMSRTPLSPARQDIDEIIAETLQGRQ